MTKDTNTTSATLTNLARAAALAAIAAAGLAQSGCASATPPAKAQTPKATAPKTTTTAATPGTATTTNTGTTAQSSNSNPFVDPFAISASGYSGTKAGAKPDGVISLNNQVSTPSQPSNAALNLYGEVMARSMAGGPGGQTPRGGGSNLSQVSFSMEGADFDPNVSSDGKQIVFASTQYRETADLFIKNVDSRVVTQLTSDAGNDVMPKLSPDGGRIAFASNRSGNWDIYVMPTAGGKPVQLTSDSADDLHPTWSPDGTQLAFCRLGEVSGQWELWVTEVGNSGVARFIGYGLFPEWCPVGGTGAGGADRIAYQKSRERGDRAFGIWTVDYKNGQAGNTTEVASTPAAACINPAWSPDGNWIAFATVPNPSKWAAATNSRPTSADLWMVDITGNSRISLTAGKAVNLMPAWGPGNRLFFVSDRGGVDNIWAMDTAKVVALAATNSSGSSSVASSDHGHASSPAPSASSGHGTTTGTHPIATVPTPETGGHDPH